MVSYFRRSVLTAALIAAPVLTAAGHSAKAAEMIGQFDPEAVCAGPVENPVCAYKTWFFCRIANIEDMCRLVLGKGPEKTWDDRPWVLPLSRLVAGPLAIDGYAFVGSRKVDAKRLGNADARLKARLLGSTEVMDTYADPEKPGVAIIGSEFYAETKPAQWKMVGWSLGAEGGSVSTECNDPKYKNDNVCSLRVEGIPSWVETMRAQGGGKP